MTNKKPLTILCVSSYYKGNRFLQQCKKEGCNVVLLTLESLLKEPWPRESIDEIFGMPSFTDRRAVINAVSFLARSREFDRIAPLDDFDVELVAHLREHLRIPGMGDTTARYFRDKLAMRARAKDRGLRVPEFVGVINHGQLGQFMNTVPGPWMLKPRLQASSVGIKKVPDAASMWPLIEALGDEQSFHLVEKMIPGDVYHVDAVVWEKQIVFAECHKYRQPIFSVTNEGGIFATTTLPRDSSDWAELVKFTQDVCTNFGIVRGVTHTEFIKSKEDGKFYFLETAARVGGANISDLVEASSGINLWEEWAKIEISQGDRPYAPPAARKDYAGLINSLARQEHPDYSAFPEPEVVWRLQDKKHHIGLIVKANNPGRVHELIEHYIPRIQRDFHAALPPPEKPTA